MGPPLLAEVILRAGDGVQPAPHEAVDEHDCQRHDEDCSSQFGEVGAERGLTDDRSDPLRPEGLTTERHNLCDDAGVPGSARRCHPTCHEVGEYGRQVQGPEALPTHNTVARSRFWSLYLP